MSATVLNFGCRLNVVESEAIRALGLPSDMVVLNSCAVTGEAVRQARQAVRRVRRERPDARVVVTGCAAEVERFEGVAVVPNGMKLNTTAYPSPSRGEVDSATAERVRVDAAVPQSIPGCHPHPLIGLTPLSRLSPQGRGVLAATDQSRAFVAVQNGCDHRCTFCIIPYGRGDSRSVATAAVVERVRELADTHNEIVLTGVDLTDWRDGDLRLGDLVAAILGGVPNLPRLRLSSIDSVEIDPLLMELIAGETRLMPHLHLSLQAGDDMILKRMKRRHSRSDAVRIVGQIKSARPDVAIGADLIAGFPTETDAMFANTLALVSDCDIVHAHIFPYSEREGTPAARMPQLPIPLRRERAARLREAAAERRRAWLRDQIGTVQDVLVERGGGGHTPGFAAVRIQGEAGRIVQARLTGLDGDRLIGAAA